MILILGLLGMYFDAVVVEVKIFTFIQICFGHTVHLKDSREKSDRVFFHCHAMQAKQKIEIRKF